MQTAHSQPIVGTPVEADVLVYEERDTGFYVALSGTQSSKYIVIDAHTHLSRTRDELIVKREHVIARDAKHMAHPMGVKQRVKLTNLLPPS